MSKEAVMGSIMGHVHNIVYTIHVAIQFNLKKFVLDNCYEFMIMVESENMKR